MGKKILHFSSFLDALDSISQTIRARQPSLDRRHVLIVPDKFTLDAETRLFKDGYGAFDVEVLTFSRLFYRLCTASDYLSREGAIMLIRSISSQLDLACYKKSARFFGFSEKVYDTFNELSDSGIDILSAKATRESIEVKLADIKKIYASYEAETKDNLIDSSGRLKLTASTLNSLRYTTPSSPSSPLPSTTQSSPSSTTTTTFGGSEGECQQFINNKDISSHHTQSSPSSTTTPSSTTSTPSEGREAGVEGGAGVKIGGSWIGATGGRFPDLGAWDVYVANFMELTALERAVLEALEPHVNSLTIASVSLSPPPIRASSVEVYKSSDRITALKAAARRIRSAVIGGLRFRDIAIVMSEPKITEAERVFSEFEIPFYLDHAGELSEHQLPIYLELVMDMLERGTRRSEMIRAAKNACFNIEKKASDSFENYVNEFNIDYKGFQSPFNILEKRGGKTFEPNTDYNCHQPPVNTPEKRGGGDGSDAAGACGAGGSCVAGSSVTSGAGAAGSKIRRSVSEYETLAERTRAQIFKRLKAVEGKFRAIDTAKDFAAFIREAISAAEPDCAPRFEMAGQPSVHRYAKPQSVTTEGIAGFDMAGQPSVHRYAKPQPVTTEGIAGFEVARGKVEGIAGFEVARGKVEEILGLMERVLGAREHRRSFFREVFSEGLAAGKLMGIPNLSDSVVIALPSTFRGQEFKYVMVLGLNEGEVPAPRQKKGLFSEDEGAIEGLERRQYNENVVELEHILYAASERIFLTFSASAESGKSAFLKAFEERNKDKVTQTSTAHEEALLTLLSPSSETDPARETTDAASTASTPARDTGGSARLSEVEREKVLEYCSSRAGSIETLLMGINAYRSYQVIPDFYSSIQAALAGSGAEKYYINSDNSQHLPQKTLDYSKIILPPSTTKAPPHNTTKPLPHPLTTTSHDPSISTSGWGADELVAGEAGLAGAGERERVSAEEVARRLYFPRREISVTRLRQYFSCPYAHFLRYGLGARERRVSDLLPMDVGTILHAVVERFTKEGGITAALEAAEISNEDNAAGLAGDDEAAVAAGDDEAAVAAGENEAAQAAGESGAAGEASIAEAAERILSSILEEEQARFGAKITESARRRLTSEASKLLSILTSHLIKGKFRPMGQEISLTDSPLVTALELNTPSLSLTLSGSVDYADSYEGSVRIIDYKTGRSDFRYGDVYYGRGIQLPLYMLAFIRSGYRAAGYFYFPFRTRWNDSETAHRLSGAFDSSEANLLALDKTLAYGTKSTVISAQTTLKTPTPAPITSTNSTTSNSTTPTPPITTPITTPSTNTPTPPTSPEVAATSAPPITNTSMPSTSSTIELSGRREYALEAKELRGICEYCERVAIRAIEEILQGYIGARPHKSGDSEACEFCPYKGTCRITPAPEIFRNI